MRSGNNTCCKKQLLAKYYECLCSFLSYPASKSYIFRAVFIFWSVVCLAVPYFSHYLIKVRFSAKNDWTWQVFWFSLRLLYATFLALRSIQPDIITNVYLHAKHLSVLSDFDKACIFYTDFQKFLKCTISWKLVQREPSCSMRTDRHAEAIVAFGNFANAPKSQRTW
jgi:hypothetical protein